MTDNIITGDEPEFFAPVATDLIDGLLGQYQHMLGKVKRVAEVMNGPDLDGALHYFAEYAGKNDKIVMNPPFNSDRWRFHTEHAATMLRAGGRLVAILPASAKGKYLPGLNCAWHGPFDNEFAGTSVSVCILVADKGGV